jgi:hypothetical protein
METTRITAKTIQAALYDRCSKLRHVLMLPNFHLFWEADFVTVTRANLIYEFEVKISLADFRADAKKEKHQFYNGTVKHSRTLPNFFAYVVPQELTAKVISNLPAHAGLMEVIHHGDSGPLRQPFAHWVTKPPRLHDKPISQELLLRMARSLMFRFYDLRDRMARHERQGAVPPSRGEPTPESGPPEQSPLGHEPMPAEPPL